MLKGYISISDAMFNVYGYEKAMLLLGERTSNVEYLSNAYFYAMAHLFLMRYRHGKYPCLYEWATFVHYFRKVK